MQSMPNRTKHPGAKVLRRERGVDPYNETSDL